MIASDGVYVTPVDIFGANTPIESVPPPPPLSPDRSKEKPSEGIAPLLLFTAAAFSISLFNLLMLSIFR
jgi:hypothetical protein